MMNTILLNGLWQGALITAIAALATMLVPQRNAATRYAIWFVALLALFILPIATLWHPAEPLLPSPVEDTAAATSIVTAKAASASGAWLPYVWLGGFAFCLFRLGLSYARIDRIVRNATPAPEIGPEVLTSTDVGVPIAARFFSPVIVLPARLATSLERGDLESIVRHERAHIRRMDIAGNFLQRIVEACLFFNPWAYVIGRQLVKEREASCDDWAVHAGEPDRYASCLAQLAQGAHHTHAPLLTPSAIGSRRMLVGRIARLLNGKVTQLKVNYLALGASVTAFALLAILLQTSNGLASNGSLPSEDQLAVASGRCVYPVIPKDTSHLSAAQRAALRAQLLATSADVKPINPVAPDVTGATYPPNVSAVVLVTVAANGEPVSAKVSKSSGNAGFDRATVKAALASTYSPAMSNCKAITGQYLFRADTGPN